MIQEERSIFLELIVSVTVRKKEVHVIMFLILISRSKSLVFLFDGLNEEGSSHIKDELLSLILNAAGCINKRDDQLRRTTSNLSTRDAK